MKNPLKKREKPAERKALELATTEVNPHALIMKALEHGADVDTLQQLFELANSIKDREAREAYNKAMAKFQKACPPIPKTERATFRTKSGHEVEYWFAPLPEINRRVIPEMVKLGLSVSYRERQDENYAYATARISHEMGHFEESGETAIPIEKTTTGTGTLANPAQRVGIAKSYAKRYAFLAILGLAPEDDPDADTDNLKPKHKDEPIDLPQTTDGSGLWHGVVQTVDTKKGTSKKTGKDWTLYTLKTAKGEFTTFDKSIAEFAVQHPGQKLALTLEKTEHGIKVIEIGLPG